MILQIYEKIQKNKLFHPCFIIKTEKNNKYKLYTHVDLSIISIHYCNISINGTKVARY